MADALSGDPFVKPLRERLLCESYSELLNQARDVDDGCVQDTFHLICLPQSLGSPSAAVDASLSEDDVSSLLSSLNDWDAAPSQALAQKNCKAEQRH